MARHQKSTAPVPTQVMHEDDPVLIRHHWLHLTRKQVKIIGGALATATFILLCVVLWQVIGAVDAINQEKIDRRNDVNQAVCSLIDAVPPGDARIDASRIKFNCGAYIPESNSPFTSRSSEAPHTIVPTEPRSTPSASTPSTPTTHTTPETIPTLPLPTSVITKVTTLTRSVSLPTITITLPGNPITICPTGVIPVCLQ